MVDGVGDVRPWKSEEGATIESCTSAIDTLERKIQRLGAINLAAIEEVNTNIREKIFNRFVEPHRVGGIGGGKLLEKLHPY